MAGNRISQSCCTNGKIRDLPLQQEKNNVAWQGKKTLQFANRKQLQSLYSL